MKLSTIRFHDDLETLMQKLHIDYINHNLDCKKHPVDSWEYNGAVKTFAEYLTSRYIHDLDFLYKCEEKEWTTKTGKPKPPPNLTDDDGLVQLAVECGFDTTK